MTETLKVLSSNNFHWHGYHGYADASEMPGYLGLTESFAVRSERTGTLRLFNFAHANTTTDGTVVSWLFDADTTEEFISITVRNDHSTTY